MEASSTSVLSSHQHIPKSPQEAELAQPVAPPSRPQANPRFS